MSSCDMQNTVNLIGPFCCFELCWPQLDSCLINFAAFFCFGTAAMNMLLETIGGEAFWQSEI